MPKMFTAAGFWQSTASALFGMMLSVGTLWMSGSFNHVSRAEVSEMISTESPASPYLEDRNLILSVTSQNGDDIKSLIGENKRLGELVSRLIGTIEARGND